MRLVRVGVSADYLTIMPYIGINMIAAYIELCSWVNVDVNLYIVYGQRDPHFTM